MNSIADYLNAPSVADIVAAMIDLRAMDFTDVGIPANFAREVVAIEEANYDPFLARRYAALFA